MFPKDEPAQGCRKMVGALSRERQRGEMAEWFKAAVLKTAVLETVPGVRIPLSPPPVATRI